MINLDVIVFYLFISFYLICSYGLRDGLEELTINHIRVEGWWKIKNTKIIRVITI